MQGDRGPEGARLGCRVVAPAKAAGEVPGVGRYVREGDTVRGRRPVRPQVWDTPGHCVDHISYWFAADRAVFAGDTLFTLGCGRVLGSRATARCGRSLQRLAALPDEARVYSGHDYTLANARFALAADPDNDALEGARAPRPSGPRRRGGSSIPSTIGEEKATNPFLRAGEPAVARSAGQEGAATGGGVPGPAGVEEPVLSGAHA